MATLEQAIAIAAEAHRNQTDRAGQPYILHPLRLMMQATNPTHQIVAVLHDVIEDSQTTAEDLRQAGFNETIVAAVEALTHDKGGDEDYFDYVRRAAANPIARQIKRLDLLDNLNVNRLNQITEKDIARLSRYHQALAIITQSND